MGVGMGCRGFRSRLRGGRRGRAGGGREGRARGRGVRGLMTVVVRGRICWLFGRRFGRGWRDLGWRPGGWVGLVER